VPADQPVRFVTLYQGGSEEGGRWKVVKFGRGYEAAPGRIGGVGVGWGGMRVGGKNGNQRRRSIIGSRRMGVANGAVS